MDAPDRPNSIRKAAALAFFLLVHAFAAVQLGWVARDLVTGDGSASRLVVPLRYPPMRVPAPSPLVVTGDAAGRPGADFAQIYFPARSTAPLRHAYSAETTSDPWRRPSRYPPLLHLLSSATLARLPYGWACLVHLALQVLLVLASLAFALRALGLRRHILPTLVLFDACLFLSPVGLSCLERGQFSLYVGLAYLWLVLALVTGRWRYAVVAALFAFVKWTALPFVAVALALALALSRDRAQLRQRLGLAAAFGLAMVALTFCLPGDALAFVDGLLRQESEMAPTGNSLAKLLPRTAVKLLPLGLVVGGALFRLSAPRPLASRIPFLAAAGTVLATYPTSSFDYSTPYLMAFVPLLLHWGDSPEVGPRAGPIAAWGFAAYLLLASFARAVFGTSESIVIGSYALAAALLACAPLFARPRTSPTPAASTR